ncbi:hypothetical protein BDR26DRAFT_1003182 [Obelidium mucronatum]|nr:hypothetical protein BDR26DRAFT_1003182 [Obelidium mucronatum]
MPANNNGNHRTSDSTLHNEPRRLEPTTFQRVYSWGYLLIRSVISGAISGAINYGIAYAMYSEPAAQPHAFNLPSSLLGNFVITTLIQGFLIWIITVFGTFADLRSGLALPYITGHKTMQRLLSIHYKPSVNSNLERALHFWVPIAGQIDILAPTAPYAERMSRLKRNFKMAGYSCLISIPVYTLLAVIYVFPLFGMGFYNRVDAMRIIWVFSGIIGFLSSIVITWIVQASQQLQLVVAQESKPTLEV